MTKKKTFAWCNSELNINNNTNKQMRWDIFLRFVHILHCRRKEEAINDEVEKKQTKSNSLTRNFKVYKAELYFGMIQL